MPEIVSVADRPRERFNTRNGGSYWRIQLIDHPKDELDAPEAFIIDGDPGRGLRTHFHDVDQFQIITNGDGTLGRHGLVELGVHFARAYTPYGPIMSGRQGLGYLTLRARRDPLIAQYVPECNEKLKSIPGRAPWQKTVVPQIPELAPGQLVAANSVPGLDDGQGMAVHAMRLAPGASAQAPDPAASGGQFVVAMKGGIVDAGVVKPAITVVHVAADEPAFTVQAGPEGAAVLVFCFPRQRATAAAARPATGDFKVWQCALCNFVYDEAVGIPEEGIAAGTRWADVPESWGCPDCSAKKADFEMVEI